MSTRLSDVCGEGARDEKENCGVGQGARFSRSRSPKFGILSGPDSGKCTKGEKLTNTGPETPYVLKKKKQRGGGGFDRIQKNRDKELSLRPSRD